MAPEKSFSVTKSTDSRGLSVIINLRFVSLWKAVCRCHWRWDEKQKN